MKFQQRQLTRTTLLALRDSGLYVSQHDGRGQADIAVEIPYEELLPLRLEYRRHVPLQALPLVLLGVLLWGTWLLQPWLAARPLPDNWLPTLEAGLSGLALLVYAWYNWWHRAVVHTPHLRVVLADLPRDRRALRQFVGLATDHTKAYLRREYAPVNPLGLIEPQLRRLAWLHELAVLDTPEAQALATRLTGKLPGRGFRSMGQRLEAPYVN